MTNKQPGSTIFQVLRDRICLLEYPPGTVLREASLAEEFNVSRTPIRAVLQQLAHGGLIESKDGVGNLVTDPDPAYINDIYQMRLKIAELIGQMSPKKLGIKHLRIVEELQERCTALELEFNIREYWLINHDLHAVVASIIGNRTLRKMWDELYFQAARIWYQHARQNPSGVIASMQVELSEVKRAIENNDAVALGYIQRNYIAYGLAQLTQSNQKARQIEEK